MNRGISRREVRNSMAAKGGTFSPPQLRTDRDVRASYWEQQGFGSRRLERSSGLNVTTSTENKKAPRSRIGGDDQIYKPANVYWQLTLEEGMASAHLKKKL